MIKANVEDGISDSIVQFGSLQTKGTGLQILSAHVWSRKGIETVLPGALSQPFAYLQGIHYSSTLSSSLETLIEKSMLVVEY